jgi:hypothetical protein
MATRFLDYNHSCCCNNFDVLVIIIMLYAMVKKSRASVEQEKKIRKVP